MARTLRALFLITLVFLLPGSGQAAPVSLGHVVGSATAPIQVDEFASITCSHCGHFALKTLPELEERYVKTGLVRFVLHDFPLDGISLKGAAIAQCLSSEQYLPFIRTLYESLASGAFGSKNFETQMLRYASLSGLEQKKAKACANDEKMQNAIIEARAEAIKKYDIQGTPTFVINDGEEIINGAQSAEAFAAVFDRLLAKKRK